ncbi:MAG: hypothetical protein SNH79_07355 [Rikenellaceae bacterium]
MKKKPVYLTFASPKGGVGKTSITTITASYMHYKMGYNVAVVDCNFPSYPHSLLRDRELDLIVNNADVRDRVRNFYRATKMNSYKIVNSCIESAIRDAEFVCKNNDIDLVLFDLPPLMMVDGASELLSKMNVVIVPTISDLVCVETTLRYVSALNDGVISQGMAVGGVSSVHILKNMINHWGLGRASYADSRFSELVGVEVMEAEMPYTQFMQRQLAESPQSYSISTLLAPTITKKECRQISQMVEEVEQIISKI